MGRSLAKGIFFINLSIVGLVLSFAIYQVPQPWRGILVAWLLILASLGTFILRLIGHYYEYKALQLTTKKNNQPAKQAPKRKAPRRATKLRVIQPKPSRGGRHIIR